MRAPSPEPEALLQPAFAALAGGDITGAVAALEEAVTAEPELAPPHELLGRLSCGALDDYDRARRHLAIACRLYRGSGDLRTAAGTAVGLAQVDLLAGDGPGSRGWLGRARSPDSTS
jgi:tetratricopeptide (TPR) repeat protein